MKSRDELAEAAWLAMLARGTALGRDALAGVAFADADAFVAERERRGLGPRQVAALEALRGIAPEEPDAPTGGGVVCTICSARTAIHADDCEGPGAAVPCCGHTDCCVAGVFGWSRAPLAPETPPAFVDETRPLTPESIAAVEAHARSRPPLPVIQTKPHAPERGCAGCGHLDLPVLACGHPSVPVSAPARLRVLPLDAETSPAPSWCPKRAKPEALRFSDDGDLLNADGDATDTAVDGYAGWVLTDEVAVYFKPKDRAHAERIMAAALAAGRAVEP